MSTEILSQESNQEQIFKVLREYGKVFIMSFLIMLAGFALYNDVATYVLGVESNLVDVKKYWVALAFGLIQVYYKFINRNNH